MENYDPEERPELFFGLVGAAGTELDKVTISLEDCLKKVGYKTKHIWLSKLIEKKEFGNNKKWKSEYERIKVLQSVGDKFRKKCKDGGTVVLLGISDIRKYRRSITNDPDDMIKGQAYIIKSLKNIKEVDILKKIYGDNFWLLSAYTPRNLRKEKLITDIKKNYVGNDSKVPQYAEELIERDLHNSNNKFGQDVRCTFPLGDIFINVSDLDFNYQINRFVELIFGNTFWTPTIEEYGMFHAKASALRSSSLSRQVGTSILSMNDDLISTGINEVPKFGGGHYVEGEINDYREFKIGEDSNHIKRNDMLRDVFLHLRDAKWFQPKYIEKNVDNLVFKALKSNKLKSMKFLNVTEFGREVHAEMSALMDASRRTISVKNGVLYCTVFPCHVCAKHIIASGIKKVVYIEPYPKSLAQELFRDSISVDESSHNNEVEFKPFVGISPRRYMQLFEMKDRKNENTGKKKEWDPTKAVPRYVENRLYVDDEVDEIKTLKKLAIK